MNFALMTCTDGKYLLRSQHGTRDAALIAYDTLHAALINDKTMKYGVIAILDENLNIFEGRADVIDRREETPAE